MLYNFAFFLKVNWASMATDHPNYTSQMAYKGNFTLQTIKIETDQLSNIFCVI